MPNTKAEASAIELWKSGTMMEERLERVIETVNLFANVNTKDEYGKSLLHIAVGLSDECEKIVQVLLDKGANVNDSCNERLTALHIAIERKNLKIVKLLLDKGADVDAKNKENKSPLYLSTESGQADIVAEILQHGPDLNDESNKSALHFAIDQPEEEFREIVNDLFAYGFKVDCNEECSSACLRTCVEKKYVEIVEDILRRRVETEASQNSIVKELSRLLHYAAKHGPLEIVKLLIEYGADVNDCSEQRTNQ